MRKKVTLKKIFSLVFILLFVQLSLNAQFLTNKQEYKLLRVLQLIKNNYVEDVDDAKLVETAIVKMLEELDPHSVYISPEDVKAMNEPLDGNFDGIGVQFNIMRDTIYVVTPVVGGPSEKVGIRAGDRIVKIDGEVVAGVGINNKGVFDRLRGEKGTKVEVSIKRKDEDKLLDFVIVRDKIPIYSVDAVYMLDSKTGYIKINRFAKTTFNEFKEGLEKLKKSGAENLVVDLTGNGGGFLDQAVLLADEFLVKDQLIVYTEGLNSEKHQYSASEYGDFEKGKLAILIDEGSASASEILAGAVQDWDRGVIVGRRSFGKGLVQNQAGLPDGSMIRLTVSRYHTPTGRMIQKPYEMKSEEYHRDILNRYKNGELSDESAIEYPDSLKYKTLVKGRVVYGGGGIMPDVFVPIDTTEFSDYYSALVRKGVLNQYVLNYVDKNRQSLVKKYHGLGKFINSFDVSDKMLKELIDAGEKEKVVFVEEEFKTSKQLLKLIIKGLIARDLFDTSAYFEIVNSNNDMIVKALELLNEEKFAF